MAAILELRACEPLVSAERVGGLDGFDAVAVGSAVYAGHGLKPARELVDRLGGELAGRPVGLFSSGPVGDPPRPDAAQLPPAGDRVGPARPRGDFRDWAEVRRWAVGIADALTGRP
jgi:menaquinone-dependent protoporphyrinogen oxidase